MTEKNKKILINFLNYGIPVILVLMFLGSFLNIEISGNKLYEGLSGNILLIIAGVLGLVSSASNLYLEANMPTENAIDKMIVGKRSFKFIAFIMAFIALIIVGLTNIFS
jgi:hypothetical protein